MALIGEFGAALDEVERKVNPNREPDEFRFYGETFQIADEVGVIPLLKFGHAAASGLDTSDMEGLDAMYSMLRDCLAEGQFSRFLEVGEKNKADADTLLRLVSEVYRVVSGRPTVRPSDSSDGRPPTSPSSSTPYSKRESLGLVPVSTLAG